MNLSVAGRKLLPFLGQTIRNSVFSNSISLIILRGSTTATRILILFIIARFSAPKEFGLISYAIAVTEIAEVIADFGVDTLAVREFAIIQGKAEQRTFAKTVALAKLVCTIIIYVAVVAFLTFTLPLNSLKISLVVTLLIFTAVAGTFSINYFQARLQIYKILLPVLLNNIVTIFAVILLFLIHPVTILAVAILPIAEAINDGILLRMLLKELDIHLNIFTIAQHFHWSTIIHLLQRTLPLALTNIIVVLYTRLDVVVLSNFLDQASVGYYGIAFRMTEPFQLVAAGFALSLYSHLSALLLNANSTAIKGFLLRYGAGILTYSLLTSSGLALIAPIIIRYWLPAYIPAVPILQILAIAVIFRTLNTNLTSVIMAYGRFKWITGLATWNLVAIGGLLLICVPLLGPVGAALALLIGEVINTLIQIFLTRKVISVKSKLALELE